MKTIKSAVLIFISLLLLLTAACGAKKESGIPETSVLETVQSVEADTMRLISEERVVMVKDENDVQLPTSAGMRLFSGYEVKTGSKSKAGISLDDTKAATLGESTLTELTQEAKHLSLNLVSGELYFNVTKPVTAEENFEINTSTMTLGIRGTCGYVLVVDDVTTQIILATGEALITASDGSTQTIEGGQQVTVSITSNGAKFTVRSIYPADYPALLAEGIAADNIVPEEREKETLPEDGDRIVFRGTLYAMSYYDFIDYLGYADPNYNAAYTDTNEIFYFVELDEPQLMNLMTGDGMGVVTEEREVSLIRIRSDATVTGSHIVSIDPTKTFWPTDTSIPLGAPRTSDIHILD